MVELRDGAQWTYEQGTVVEAPVEREFYFSPPTMPRLSDDSM